METALGKFRLAHASGGDWETLTRDCLDQLDDEQGGGKRVANLGFLSLIILGGLGVQCNFST